MALTNLENIVVAKKLEAVKAAYSQDYFQPGLNFALNNFGPGFRVWQRPYQAMILDLMSKAVAADAAALALLTTTLGRAYIKNSDGIPRTFIVDGLPRTLANGDDWCLHLTVINLIKQQAALLGYNITDTTDADYALNGVVETFGD